MARVSLSKRAICGNVAAHRGDARLLARWATYRPLLHVPFRRVLLAPAYPIELCSSTLSALGAAFSWTWSSPCSSSLAHTSIRQKRAFLVVGPSIWNGLHL